MILTSRRQTIFADSSFSKPFFVTYVNSSFFSIFLLIIFLRRLWISKWDLAQVFRGGGGGVLYAQHLWIPQESEAFLKPDVEPPSPGHGTPLLGPSTMIEDVAVSPERFASAGWKVGLNDRETARLSLEFSVLWVRNPTIDRSRQPK